MYRINNFSAANHEIMHDMWGEKGVTCGVFGESKSITTEEKTKVLASLKEQCKNLGQLNNPQKDQVVKFIKDIQQWLNRGSTSNIELQVPVAVLFAFGLIQNTHEVPGYKYGGSSLELDDMHGQGKQHARSVASLRGPVDGEEGGDAQFSVQVTELITDIRKICAHQTFYTPWCGHASKTNWFCFVNMTATANALCEFIINHRTDGGQYGATAEIRGVACDDET